MIVREQRAALGSIAIAVVVCVASTALLNNLVADERILVARERPTNANALLDVSVDIVLVHVVVAVEVVLHARVGVGKVVVVRVIVRGPVIIVHCLLA